LSNHQLARKLKGYGIRSKNVRIGHDIAKGYERGQFDDAFARYLSSPIPPSQTATPLQPSNHAGFGVAVCKTEPLHPPPNRYTATHGDGEKCSGVAVCSGSQKQTATREAAPALGCSGVAVCGGGTSEEYTEDEAYDLV
jgi:putative DNA primase/helicase